MSGVDDAIAFLSETTPGKNSKVSIEERVVAVETAARSEGLTGKQLLQLIPVATSGVHYISVARRLIKCMVPRTSVPEDAAVMVVARFNTVLARPLQALLLQWLLLVFDLLESKEQLHNLYGVLFFWMEYESLRPHLCHLLYLLTRRQDVQPFRVRRLMKLQQQVGPEPDVVALLSCYKLLCPSMVTLVVKSNRTRWFPVLDRKWRADIAHVQDVRRRRGSSSNFGRSAEGLVRISKDPALKQAFTAIPALQEAVQLSPRAGVSHLHPGTAATRDGPGLRAIDTMSFTELADNLEKMEMPAQLAAILHSRRLQHVLTCAPDLSAIRRLGHWILCRLSDDDGLDKSHSAPETDVLLQALASFATFLGETPEVVDDFLTSYLKRWNGMTYRRHVLRLVAMLPPRPYEVLYQTVLKPLNKLLVSSDVSCQVEILQCYTRMAKSYATRDWDAYYRDDPEEHRGSLMGAPMPRADYIRTLRELVAHVDASCALCLQLRPGHVRVLDATLCFFEMANRFCQGYNLPLVAIPSPAVVYACALTGSAMNVSRICGILARARTEYQVWQGRADAYDASPVPSPKSVENIEYFNSYIMDFVNTFWRSRTLASKEEEQSALMDEVECRRRAVLGNTTVKAADAETRRLLARLREGFVARIQAALAPELCAEANVADRLTLAKNWFCAGHARRFLEANLEDGARVVPESVRPLRRTFVGYLEKEAGMTGLVQFLQSFISLLMASTAQA